MNSGCSGPGLAHSFRCPAAASGSGTSFGCSCGSLRRPIGLSSGWTCSRLRLSDFAGSVSASGISGGAGARCSRPLAAGWSSCGRSNCCGCASQGSRSSFSSACESPSCCAGRGCSLGFFGFPAPAFADSRSMSCVLPASRQQGLFWLPCWLS